MPDLSPSDKTAEWEEWKEGSGHLCPFVPACAWTGTLCPPDGSILGHHIHGVPTLITVASNHRTPLTTSATRMSSHRSPRTNTSQMARGCSTRIVGSRGRKCQTDLATAITLIGWLARPTSGLIPSISHKRAAGIRLRPSGCLPWTARPIWPWTWDQRSGPFDGADRALPSRAPSRRW